MPSYYVLELQENYTYAKKDLRRLVIAEVLPQIMSLLRGESHNVKNRLTYTHAMCIQRNPKLQNYDSNVVMDMIAEQARSNWSDFEINRQPSCFVDTPDSIVFLWPLE